VPGSPARASLADVARQARVSLSTASRVANDNGYPVAPGTRDRVLAAVRALNYSPSALARALVTKRTNIVGVLVGDVGDPYFAEIVRGVEDVARRAGYLVIVCNSDRDPHTELGYLRSLLDYHVDGIVLAGGGLLDTGYGRALKRAVAELERHGTVVVALAKTPAMVPSVTIDNHAAAVAMTAYLVNLGHRRLAVIAGPPNVTTARERLQGVLDGLGARGLEPHRVVEGNFTALGGAQAAAELLDLATPPSAMFAMNDLMAIGALETAHERGVDIPGELTLVSFGDTAASRQAWPPLTSVSVPRHELGATAMEALLGQLQEGRPIANKLLSFGLAIRASSAPPRDTGGARLATSAAPARLDSPQPRRFSATPRPAGWQASSTPDG